MPSGESYEAHNLDADFSMDELRMALQTCRRDSGPGEDGITYQALFNLDMPSLPILLEHYNKA